ncbi:MAG TPA: hypothetical protein VMZ25_01160 [Terriglobales bacterium]|nr:hypothetical protein [Terriglobales bacterium]
MQDFGFSFPSNVRKRLAKDSKTSSRLVVGKHYADIVPDPKNPGMRFHWVVQQVGSADVLAWGQESSFELAEKAAYQFLHDRLTLNAKQTG